MLKSPLLIACLLYFTNTLPAQQILSKGDIIVIGMSTATQFDEFSWIPTVNLSAGTKIYFSDAGYDRINNRFLGVNPVTSVPILTEGLYRYLVPAGGLNAGTIVTITENNSAPVLYQAVTGTTFGNDLTLTLSNSGDQIIVFQSTDTEGTMAFGTTNLTVIYQAALSTTEFSTYVYNPTLATEFDKATNLHPQLDPVAGSPNCFVAVGIAIGQIDESDNARYQGEYTYTNKADWLTAFATLSNWKRYNNPSPDGGAYQMAIPTAANWTRNGQTTLTVLPLKLVAFSGRSADQGIYLQWVTAEEINTSSVDIERSVSGSDFIKIGNLLSRPSGGSYSFTDAKSLPGVLYYYRLKLIDIDGRFSYSGVKSVQLIGGNRFNFSIYPNPVTGETINLRPFSLVSEALQLKIIGLSGKVLYQQTAEAADINSGNIAIPVRNVPSGVYFLQILDVNKKLVQSIKFTR